MTLKLIVIALYLTPILAPMTSFVVAGNRPDGTQQATPVPSGKRVINLDLHGFRGLVAFNHDNHTSRINPDPNAIFKVKPGASCSGCHHTSDPSNGVPQLWKCTACHRSSGNLENPKGKDFDEQWSETAFHNLCIQCHIASRKGPTRCGDCHQPGGTEAARITAPGSLRGAGISANEQPIAGQF
jgi:hypothetical protein